MRSHCSSCTAYDLFNQHVGVDLSMCLTIAFAHDGHCLYKPRGEAIQAKCVAIRFHISQLAEIVFNIMLSEQSDIKASRLLATNCDIMDVRIFTHSAAEIRSLAWLELDSRSLHRHSSLLSTQCCRQQSICSRCRLDGTCAALSCRARQGDRRHLEAGSQSLGSAAPG